MIGAAKEPQIFRPSYYKRQTIIQLYNYQLLTRHLENSLHFISRNSERICYISG